MGRRVVAFLRLLLTPSVAALCWSCASVPAPAPPPAVQAEAVGPTASFCLFPTKDGKVGRVVVSNEKGQQVLSAANQEVAVGGPQEAPGTPRILSEREVQETYGAALSALPASPAHFILYFETRQSQVLM